MEKSNRFEEWKPLMVIIPINLSVAILNILLKKVLDEGTNHLVFITYRLAVATIFLAPISYVRERKNRPKLTFEVLCYLFFSALLGSSFTQYCFLLGIQYTSATFTSGFTNMVPVVTFIMALLFRLETVNMKSSGGRAKIFGAMVGVGGAMVLTLYKGMPLFNHHSHAVNSSSTKRTDMWTLGCAALVVGTLLWSSWFLVLSHISKIYPYQYSSTTIMSCFGALQSAILSLSRTKNFSVWVLKGKTQIITTLFAGIVGSGLNFVGMSWCIRKRGPVFTTAFGPLVQIMSGIIGVPLLHEELRLGSIFGSFLVVIGMYILLWGKKKETLDSLQKLAQGVDIVRENAQQRQAAI